MYKYIFRATWTYLAALLLLGFIFYALYTQFNGNPFLAQYQSYAVNNDFEGYNNLLAAYDVDKAPAVRYGIWLNKFFNGDWSAVFNTSDAIYSSSYVPDVLFIPLRTSVQFLVPGFFIALILGFPLGVLMGYQFAARTRRGRIVDSVLGGITQMLSSVPSFIWAVFFLLLGPLISIPTTYNVDNGTDYQIKSLILPTLILVMLGLVDWTIRLRIEVANVLVSDFILAARARGFSRWFIFRNYVLRNALYPYVGNFFSNFLLVFGGSVVIERYFSIRGVAVPLVAASIGGEINILMFNVVFFGMIGALANVFQLAMQLSIDPRVRSKVGQDYKVVTQGRAYLARRKEHRVQLAGAGGTSD